MVSPPLVTMLSPSSEEEDAGVPSEEVTVDSFWEEEGSEELAGSL
jgi:hypothetical protein